MKTLRFNAIKILNEQRQQKIYKSMHKNAKKPHESVGWLSEERQNIRFEKLICGLDLSGKKILDFGCGLGAFYGFLQNRGIDCDYIGIDIVEGFVKKAKSMYPKAKFLRASIMDIRESFDYVFSSGVYAFCTKELFLEYVKKAYALSSCEYRFNVLIDARSGGYFRILKEELDILLKDVGGQLGYEFGYLDNDITVILQKL